MMFLWSALAVFNFVFCMKNAWEGCHVCAFIHALGCGLSTYYVFNY